MQQQIQLTPHQGEKGDEIINLFKAGHKRVVLIGSAGVGKTVLASWLANYFRKSFEINQHYNNGLVFVTAPTNKALSVLQTKIKIPVEFKTIHSALRLAKWTDPKTGRDVFKRVFSKEDLFKVCKIAMIDESSMLSRVIEGGDEIQEDGSKQYLKGYLDDYSFPILYIGDDKQLNPVGEPFSPAFHKGYPTVELTEIIRQGPGNPIIDLSRDTDMIFFKTPSMINGKGYMYNDDKSLIIENLAEVNGTDEMKYLAFTNSDVDAINKSVRERIYGNPSKVEKDEVLVFNSPMGEIFTNKEVKVEELTIHTSAIPIPRFDTKFDSMNQPISRMDTVRLKYYRCNNSFNVIHEDSEKVYQSICATLKYNCGKLGWNYRGKAYFESIFADTKYNHAITIHKSLN